MCMQAKTPGQAHELASNPGLPRSFFSKAWVRGYTHELSCNLSIVSYPGNKAVGPQRGGGTVRTHSCCMVHYYPALILGRGNAVSFSYFGTRLDITCYAHALARARVSGNYYVTEITRSDMTSLAFGFANGVTFLREEFIFLLISTADLSLRKAY